MHKRIWITRTLPGASQSASAFEKRGFSTVIEPLIEIRPPALAPSMPTRDAVLLFTSSNAVRMFANLTDHRHWRVLTVGDATARAARKIGFSDVMSADGNWLNLASLTKREVPKGTKLFHLCGDRWRGPLVETLSDSGYRAVRSILYESPAVSDLPEIDLNALTHVAFHSPRAARIFSKLVGEAAHITSLSISPATDQALEGIRLKERLISETPNETGMLAALGA